MPTANLTNYAPRPPLTPLSALFSLPISNLRDELASLGLGEREDGARGDAARVCHVNTLYHKHTIPIKKKTHYTHALLLSPAPYYAS